MLPAYVSLCVCVSVVDVVVSKIIKSHTHAHTHADTNVHGQKKREQNALEPSCCLCQRHNWPPTHRRWATHMTMGVWYVCVCATRISWQAANSNLYTHTHTHKGKEELRNHSTQYSHFIRHFAVTTPITLARGRVRGGRRGTTIAKPNDVVEGVTPKRRKETREMAENSPQLGNLPQKQDRLPGSHAVRRC